MSYIDVADKTTLDAVDSNVSGLNTKIGGTTDLSGTVTTGSVMGKLNRIIEKSGSATMYTAGYGQFNQTSLAVSWPNISLNAGQPTEIANITGQGIVTYLYVVAKKASAAASAPEIWVEIEIDGMKRRAGITAYTGTQSKNIMATFGGFASDGGNITRVKDVFTGSLSTQSQVLYSPFPLMFKENLKVTAWIANASGGSSDIESANVNFTYGLI